MTLPLEAFGPLAELGALREPVLGIDLSTVRAAGAVVLPTVVEHRAGEVVSPAIVKRRSVGPSTGIWCRGPAVMEWSTVTLTRHDHVAFRQVLAVDAMAGWLQDIEARFGRPARVGLEVPLAGPRTPIVSFYMLGALYVALGQVWGPGMPVREWGVGSWKLRATGSGYAPGLPKGATKAQKRAAEKARVLGWARAVCGYRGTVDDESDAAGVAVATGLEVIRS